MYSYVSFFFTLVELTKSFSIHVASKRKRWKLISEIWNEAEPIYKEGKLVEGKCNHCHKIFAAGRDTGTSHMKRHLTVCEAKSAMNDMVAKMGCPDAIDIRCSVLNIHCSDIIAFFLL